jgi:hypothetical protein
VGERMTGAVLRASVHLITAVKKKTREIEETHVHIYALVA